MKKKVLDFMTMYFVIFTVVLVLTLIFKLDEFSFWPLAGSSAIFASIIALLLTLPVSSNNRRTHIVRFHKTGFISCKKCGYIGVGSGHCTRCGSNFIEPITESTSLISCRKCGYIGAGSGFCTRCGSTWVEKI